MIITYDDYLKYKTALDRVRGENYNAVMHVLLMDEAEKIIKIAIFT